MSSGQIKMEFDGRPDATDASLTVSGASRPVPRHALTRDDVMTASEVGTLLHLASSSIYDLARRGAIPGHRVGRAWRFIRYEIEDWLRAS